MQAAARRQLPCIALDTSIHSLLPGRCDTGEDAGAAAPLAWTLACKTTKSRCADPLVHSVCAVR